MAGPMAPGWAPTFFGATGSFCTGAAGFTGAIAWSVGAWSVGPRSADVQELGGRSKADSRVGGSLRS